MQHPVQTRYEGTKTLDECCNEYIHEILNLWTQYESEYDVVDLKRVKIALFPLLVALRKSELGVEQLAQLARVLDALVQSNFNTAKQEYLTLSIGKSKFPIGLSNVGIHERKQHSSVKPGSADQNMVLEDWCVNLKRLINFMEWAYIKGKKSKSALEQT